MLYSTARQEPPERLIGQLIRQLRNHALRDSLLIFCPPLIATLYILALLRRSSWIPPVVALAVAGLAMAIAAAAVVLRWRPQIPTAGKAARLVDEKAEAEDRFTTLATLAPSSRSGALFERLRREAAGLTQRVQIRLDFPYHIKPSFYRSAIVSLIVAVLFQLLLPFAQSSLPVSAASRLEQLAQRMAQHPQLSELAGRMKTLANRLKDPKLPAGERQALIQEMEKKIEQQLQKENQPESRNLLGEAAGTL
ncbi:MAG TPA: hypothetical protein VE131_03585, partial [Terriglobales bacterium]|nr:hypothetical protein [Terriglobales bacterium]